MDPPSRERRYDLVTGGAAARGLKYAVQRHLHIEWDDWIVKPWYDQATYIEGLMREGLYDPTDYQGGDVDEDLDNLAAKGYSVGVEHLP